jgi:hypothetical protein
LEREPSPVRGLLANVVDLPPGGLALLHGPRGVGKTTIMLGMLEQPWLVTSEMDPQELLRYAKRQGAELAGVSRFTWIGEPTNEILLNVRRGGFDVPPDVLFDSASATGHPVEAVQAMRRRCARYGTRGLVIVHQTKDGEARGSGSITYEVDVELRLEDDRGERRVLVEKNRYGPVGSVAYRMTTEGVSLPSPNGYYSVEGAAGRYRLVRHPAARRMFHAAYLWAVEAARDAGEELDLPAAPLAVAASPSRLYRGGWVEPQDVSERRAFAEAHGIPYFSPVAA